MNNNSTILAEDLYKQYGDIHALQGVSLKINAGQIFGLLGANGAGKTTFIKLLVGATKLNRGKLRLFSIDPHKDFKILHSRIGYMPQSPALYEDLSGAGNVRFFGQAHDIQNLGSRVLEMLELVGLSDRKDHLVGTYSGGMKQRLSLACALVHEPQLLLLDEPTAGVDLKLRASFWEHFRLLADGGTTVLVSTHQMDEAIHCDRLAILREGKVLVESDPISLLHAGMADIRIWRNGKMTSTPIADYSNNLPGLLGKDGLDSEISRIEVHVATLERLILDLIAPEIKSGKES